MVYSIVFMVANTFLYVALAAEYFAMNNIAYSAANVTAAIIYACK